ncbi:hypothetical protein [Brachybacterium sp. YJGR34]|uniref:hypothetical protein n=1 Tax=Brachybacterium sp. YJGR34 TaxID=2059911 RepID=UPI000E0C4508|nr:hypothetical protein [Brachybacterium sp. YJGR34]
MSAELAAVREVWAQRTRARTRGDVLYLVYLAVLTALIIGVPALLAAGEALARPDVLPMLLAEGAPRVASVLALALAAAAVLLGAIRGPALLSPFLTATLAASGIRRRVVLRRPFARSLAVLALASAVLAALLGATLLSAGGTDAAAATTFVVAAVGAGLLLGAAWLAGELLTAGPRRLLALALASAALLVAVLPGAGGPAGVYPVGPDGAVGPLAWALVLLGGGILAVLVGAALLDRLRGRVLAEQAARWESATIVATSGDLAAAVGTFRPPPTTGRALPAIGGGPLVLLYARRDAVTWLRSPERFVVAVLGALLAAAVLGGSILLEGPLRGGAVLLGAAALWGASGALVDGLRHGVHTLGAPGLFGQSAAVQVALHAVAPMLLLSALAALGGGVLWWTAGAGDRAALDALLLPLALAPVLVAGRMRDAAKGPMPLALSTPMPTPQGDLSVLPMLAWQADALLLAILAGAVLAGLALLGPAWIAGGSAVLTGMMTLWALGRLRALRS